LKGHTAKALLSGRKVHEIVVRFVYPSRDAVAAFAGIAVGLRAQIGNARLYSKTMAVLARLEDRFDLK
jgi:hypothetical protein